MKDTIQEKMKYLNDISRLTELKISCTDKIKVKEYAKEIIGKDICAKTYGIYNTFEDIDFSVLPNMFMLKCNHGCQMNIPCYDKKTFRYNDAKEKLNKWVTTVTGITSKEYQYSKIDRKIFAEELLTSTRNESLLDYRVWCFNGEPKFIAINSGKGMGGQQFYDLNFNEIDLYNSIHIPQKHTAYKKPKCLNDMLSYARKLSSNFKFVRVDFFIINEKIFLSEMTFSPSGYIGHFITKSGVNKDIEIGDLLKL